VAACCLKDEEESIIREGTMAADYEFSDEGDHSARMDGRKEAALGRDWPVMGWIHFLVGWLSSESMGSWPSTKYMTLLLYSTQQCKFIDAFNLMEKNNLGGVDQPGPREWREIGFIYIVIENFKIQTN
jgi:hypothetical protein